MKKRIVFALLCLGLILSFVAVSVYAYTEVSVENEFTTGIVDIELNEYTIEAGKEVAWENNVKDILPGQDICKIPRISNHGNDCYVRADIHFIDTPLTADVLYGMPEDWILAADGYYYYTPILRSGEYIDLFKGLTVPENLSEQTAESMFKIHIDVDAIQSENFAPDYTLYDPWGTVEIIDCEKEGLYDISTFKKSDNLKFKITYEGETGRLLKNEEDFFENFPVLLPGDVYTDTLQFTNDSKEKVNLYFRTKAPEGTKLLDEILLTITKNFNGNDMLVYQGNIRAADLHENILVATVDQGDSGTLTYEVSIPKELNNDYSILQDSVTWIFSTYPVENIDAVQTGDRTLTVCLSIFFVGMALLVIGGMLYMFEKARKRNEK